MSRSPERKENEKAISTGFEPAPSIRRQLDGTPLGRKPLYHKILMLQGLDVALASSESAASKVIRKRLPAGFEPTTPSETDMIDRFERSFPAIVSSDAYPWP